MSADVMPESGAEFMRVRIIASRSGDGFVALCSFPGEREYVLQHFSVKFHTQEGGILEFARSKSAWSKHGTINVDGEIVK